MREDSRNRYAPLQLERNAFVVLQPHRHRGEVRGGEGENAGGGSIRGAVALCVLTFACLMATSTTAPTSFPLIGGRAARTARSAASISACSREFSQLIASAAPPSTAQPASSAVGPPCCPAARMAPSCGDPCKIKRRGSLLFKVSAVCIGKQYHSEFRGGGTVSWSIRCKRIEIEP